MEYVPPPTTLPGTITVTTIADEYDTSGSGTGCAVREAIRAANINTAFGGCPAGGSADVIIIPAGTYTLTRTGSDDTNINGDLDITATVTLQGAGANLTIVRGSSGFTDRIVHVLYTGVYLSGVTLRNGNSGTASGGGLYNQAGAVTLYNSAVLSNTAVGGLFSAGGGLFNTGALTLTHSAVLTNTGITGGGVYNYGGTLTVLNSTLSGNRAYGDGGGLRNDYASTATLSNVTVSNNTADLDGDGSGDGGGVSTSGTATVRNTLLAGNFDNSVFVKYPDGAGAFSSQGYNLVGNSAGTSGFTGPGDILNTNALLGPLADNGGPTPTHALLAGSPAIDAGNPALAGTGGTACEASDQRLFARSADGDGNGSIRCDIGAYEVGASPSVTLTYTYDPLYRLSVARYNTGLVYTYTYDAVGNRLTQTGVTNTTVYTYDVANRLVNAGGVVFTWDANGNLLHHTGYTYTYDTANRLVKLQEGATLTYTFDYNGLGNRLRLSTNGAPTTYTLDIAAGLTQILVEGSTTYLYGNGRVAQQKATTTDYFLGDALGSVRQLANAIGALSLARWYDPYGSIVGQAGSASTLYGFTGEWGVGLIDLRARWYSPALGRFISKDVWPGDNSRPLSLHAWNYGEGNPINFVDPSGHQPLPPGPGGDDDDPGKRELLCRILPALCQPGWDPLPNFEYLFLLCPDWMQPQVLPQIHLSSGGELAARGKSNGGKTGAVAGLVARMLQLAPPSGKLVQICRNDAGCIKKINDITTELKVLKGIPIRGSQNVGLARAKIVDDVIHYGVGSAYRAADRLLRFPFDEFKKNPIAQSHSESMILQDVAARFASRPNVTGNIRLFTYIGPCPTCDSIITQFRSMFPNIELSVYYIIPYWEYVQRGTPSIPIP